MYVIETEGLTKYYGDRLAVDQISFTVERGQIYGFLGPNGSGKTTTIGMLLGVITPSSGTIRLFGSSEVKDLDEARRRIGATLESPNFYPYLSGLDNLRIVAKVKGVGEREISAALDLVGLSTRSTSRYSTYSLGMRQRLALAATIVGDPDLIILDEPANGLDPDGMREIREIILELADRGKTIFLSSHLLWEVERICTDLAILREGVIVRQGTVTEVIGGGDLVEIRGGDPEHLRSIVEEYAGAVATEVAGPGVVVELSDPNTARLNEFVANRGVYLSQIVPRRRSLEDTFMELTKPTEIRAGETELVTLGGES